MRAEDLLAKTTLSLKIHQEECDLLINLLGDEDE
jgi:hypothetical protein